LSNRLMLVIEDPNILCKVCGPNDANLKEISGLMNSRVFSRGNEIYLESQEKNNFSLFKDLIEQLVEHSKGRELDKNYIFSLFNSINPENSLEIEDFSRFRIKIPGSEKELYPYNDKQAVMINLMEQKDLVFSIGPAGTGKTYLAIAQALKEVLQKKKRKIILTRPVVEAGENLGFLPGDLEQKLNPYLRPLYDAMEDLLPNELLVRMNDNNLFEISPLAYMRGRSLKDCFIVLDEAQNTTQSQMKMFLTRIGEGSKAVVTGDVTQIDLPSSKKSGLIHACHILNEIDDIGFCYFNRNHVIRSRLVKQIIVAYEKEST
jgi:phosphate starvation-inducible PhoH-like protein